MAPSTNQHPVFYRRDALPVTKEHCQSTEGKDEEKYLEKNCSCAPEKAQFTHGNMEVNDVRRISFVCKKNLTNH